MKITERIIAKRIYMRFFSKNLINKNMYDELVSCRTVDDFVCSCITKNDIPFEEFPAEYRKLTFLNRCLNEDGIADKTKKDIKKYIKTCSKEVKIQKPKETEKSTMSTLAMTDYTINS